MNSFRIFVASSLRGDYANYRQVIRSAVASLNDEPRLKHLKMEFKSFLFEEEYTNTACNDLIQNEINLEIEESHGFVLLCDSNIGKKTVAEARKALLRFNAHQPPAFILVLKRKGDFPIADNQVSYSDFHRDYIKKYAYSKDGDIDDDALLYEYEFDTIEDAAGKLHDDVVKWLTTSRHRPLFKALIGRDIKPTFLYKDVNRIEKCNERIYFRRNFDNALDQAMIADDPVILINGASLSGKTRALYQAIRNLPDAWFYKFVEKQEDRLVTEINDIADYVEPSRSQCPLYLIFDDVHQLPASGKVALAVDRLRDAINDKNIHIIMTSTSSEESFLSADKVIKIKSLSKKEYHEAELFFRRFGWTPESGYKEIGAMMIDLETLKNTYRDFVQKPGNRQIKAARRCTLNAVKASSIWHSSNLGNVAGLYDLAKHLLLTDNRSMSEATATDLIYDAMDEIIKLPGISHDENEEEYEISISKTLPHYVQIEEYIYKYVLEKNTVDKEWKLVNTILSYVEKKSAEKLVVTLSKLARRAENRNEIATYIYDLIMEIYGDVADGRADGMIAKLKSERWYSKLVKEIEAIKQEVAENKDVDNDECSELCIYFAKIIWARMLFLPSYEEAEQMYVSLPYPLQSIPMLGALIDKSADNHLKLNKVIQEKGLEDSYYIIKKLIKGCSTFEEAYAYFRKGKLDFTESQYRFAANELKRLQETGDRKSESAQMLKVTDIRRQHFVSALNSLAGKVGSRGDLDKVLDIIRSNFLIMHDNPDLVYDKEKLTMIDLLSRLSFYGLRGAFSDIMTWGEHIPDELNGLIDDIIEAYVMTSKLYTPGYKAKQTISIIFNVFIDKCSECHYKDVMESIFMKMQVQSGKKTVNFRDSFTYSGMMRIRSKSDYRKKPVQGCCKYMDALDLYNNYIEPAAKDPDGNFRVTRFILNEILNKVRSASEYEKLSRLYDKNNVVKDIYTYNNAMPNLSYSACVRQILPQMCENNVEFDIYTLGMLIQNAPNVKVASSYLYPLAMAGIDSESNMVADEDVRKKVDTMILTFTRDLPMASQHFLWASLVETQCRDELDRKHMFQILEYLEKNVSASDMFWISDKGIIYNNCLKNRSFIRNYEEAQQFISSRKIKPDVYTFSHLSKIIISEHKASSEEVCHHLNALFSTNSEFIAKEIQENNTHIYNERIKAYGSHKDRLEMLFIFPDGTAKTEVLTSFEYVKYLADNRLPLDEFTFKTFCDIRKGYSFDLFEDLVEFIKYHGFVLTRDTVNNIARKFVAAVPDNLRQDFHNKLSELPVKDGIMCKGTAVVNMFEYGLYSLEEAFEKVDGNDTEKLYCYTQILALFRKATHYHKDKSQLFRRCMDLYHLHIKDKLKVNVDLFSNLANFVRERSELNEVFDEMNLAHVAPVSYFIPSMMRVAVNMEDVKELISIYHKMQAPMIGREGSEREVDMIVRGLRIIWSRTNDAKDKEQIQKLFTGLGEYVLSDATDSDILADFPCFKIYKSPDGTSDRLTQQVLCELLECWPYCVDKKDEADKYIERTVELMERFYNPDNDTTRGYLATALFSTAIKRLHIKQYKMFELLSQYPKLAFTFAEKFYNVKAHQDKVHLDSYETYKALVEIWNRGFLSVPEDKATDVLVTLLSSRYLKESRDVIIPAISKKWRSELTTADFIHPKDSLSSEPQKITGHRGNTVLAKAGLATSWAISPVSSRCEFLLNLYSERDGFEEDLTDSIADRLDNAFGELIEALGNPKTEDILMLSVMNIFNVLIRNSIMVPLNYAQPLLLSLVTFYRSQLNNENLGDFYRKHATDVLNRLSSFCARNSAIHKKTKVYYALFSNKIKTSQLYFICDTRALKNALTKKIY